MKKKPVYLVLAALLALTLCTGAAMAYCQPQAAAAVAGSVDPLCRHHGSGHHGGCGHHSDSHHDEEAEECGWLFRTYGRCRDVNCTKKSHSHHCEMDCTNEYHQHYGVCQYADGTLELGQKKA